MSLGLAYFFTTRRLLLRKVLIGFLTAVIALTFSSTLWGLFRLYILDYDQHIKLLYELPLDLVNYQGFREFDQPRSLAILSTTVIPTSEGKYDLVVKISNPNPKWYAQFDYQFLSEGIKSQVKSAFLLPGEEKFLIDLAVESTRVVRQPLLDIKNLRWRKILNFESFKKERLNFKIDDLAYVGAGLTEISGRVPVSKTTFKITNLSAYNFAETGLAVILYTGNRVIGANYIILERFNSGATLPVQINWFEQLGNVTRTEVLADVNILDPRVYLGFEGNGREEFRTVPKDTF